MRRLLLALLLFSVIGSAAFSKSYSYTIGASVVTSGPHTDFPIVINVTNAGLKSTANGGVVTDAQGDDINFFSDSGLTTLLKWQMTWDATTGNLIAWVKIPSLANNGVIYIGAGDAAITTFQGDSTAVWTGYTSVYLMNDTLNDSTTNANNLSVTGTDYGFRTGKVYKARDTQRSAGNYVYISDNASISVTGALTISAWVNIDVAAATQAYGVVAKYTGSGNNRSYVLAVNTSNQLNATVSPDGTFASAKAVTGSTALSTGTWYLISFVFVPSTSVTVYLNGASDGTNTTSIPASMFDGAAQLQLGLQFDAATTDFYMDGALGPVFMYPGARSSGWMTTQYTNQNDAANFGTLAEIGGATRRIYVID